jgi:hypothetical protein
LPYCLSGAQKLETLFHIGPQRRKGRLPNGNDFFWLGRRIGVPLFKRVLIQHRVQISNEVVLQDNLICEKVRKQGEGRSVQLGQLGAESLIRKLKFVRRLC